MRLVECVPNFSEGRNQKVIDAIADSIRAVSGVRLLDVDPGFSTNRTVVTFVGDPDSALEAALQAISKAAQLIDMRKHRGEHPRMGATDVCPFVPVSGVTMEECAALAEKLAKRVGELGIPVYLYGEAARLPERKSLADIRSGEYEGLCEKMKNPAFKPDFGPAHFNAEAGATVIGARQFLLAYNVNLNTRSKKLANEIALSIREAGRAKRNAKGEIEKDEAGVTVKLPGSLKEVRAVGWYVDEYKRAQVSINLTNFEVTSLHQAFDECEKQAAMLGLRVTGSEIVGLVPLKPMLLAGEHYLCKQGRSAGVSEAELLECAVQSLGLSDLSPFDVRDKIVEYRVESDEKALKNFTVKDFIDEVASESPAPGGGSVAALCGSLAAALTSMVANLSFEKKGMEKERPQMQSVAVEAQALKKHLLALVDEDMRAFNAIIDARRLPKGTDSELEQRDQAIMQANFRATAVPLETLSAVPKLLTLAAQMVDGGNPSSLSDAGVAALCALSCAEGAYYNVLINLSSLSASEEENNFKARTRKLADEHIALCRCTAAKVSETVLARIG